MSGGEPNEPWFTGLPSCETSVPCGAGQHIIRWEAGALQLPSHPDAEGEQVLAALGGERARCIALAEAWARHSGDLSVLAIGPRGPDDEITVGWDDVITTAESGFGPRPASVAGLTGPGLTGQLPAGTRRSVPGGAMVRVTARQRQMQDEMRAAQRRRDDLVALLALGYPFQVRLIGQVAAAYAGPGKDGAQGRARPALVAAVAGRLAPVAERWLGIDPDQVLVTLHHGPGWGSAELTGREGRRRLRVNLPVDWLASVWASGLALTGRHLVVAVDQPGWPRARVLGLRAPGADPELLDVEAGPDGTWDVRH